MNDVFVYGPSGSGKSTAIETLPHQNTGIICSDMKPLPFKGWKSKYTTTFEGGKPVLAKSNYVQTRRPQSVLATLRAWNQRPEIQTIVWDTMTHVIMNRFMTDPTVIGSSGWDFYKTLAREIYEILNYLPSMQKEVIVIGHNETTLDASTGNKIDGVRTVGKLLDEKVDIPSLFTVVLTTKIERDSEGKSHYNFVTQSDGGNYAKSPKGMFEELKIPNDYNLVLQKIHEYYE